MKVFDSIEKFAESTALVTGLESISYSKLATLADTFARQLTAKPKNLVFILCTNTVVAIAGYLGTLRSDNVALLLAADIDVQLLANLVDTYQPDYIWEPKNTNTFGDKAIYTHANYQLVQNPKPSEEQLNPDLNLLLSTSGSTGNPKLVRLKGESVLANAQAIVAYLAITRSEKAITTLPLNYTYGLSILNSHLLAGATMLLTDHSVITKDFWQFFKDQQATSFSGVPYTYELLKRIGFLDMELPSLRYMTQAGGKLNAQLVQDFGSYAQTKGIKFYVMYGQTEATARIAYLPPEYTLVKPTSVGKAIPGGNLSIINTNGNTITKPFIDGELVYRGVNVMMGYATSRTDLAKGDEQNGTLLTGDIAHFDEDGFCYITGRRKRFLKMMGVLFNLDDLENFLKQQGYECACGGKDDALCIAFTKQVPEKELKRQLQQKYKLNPNVITIVYVEELARTGTGKMAYEQIFRNVTV